MLHAIERQRVYPPETLAVMTAAFDQACQSIPKSVNGNNDMRGKLALIIIQYVDQGERDPVRLAKVAFRELAGLNGSTRSLSRRPVKQVAGRGRRAGREPVDQAHTLP
jgi:hypothetical protein